MITTIKRRFHENNYYCGAFNRTTLTQRTAGLFKCDDTIYESGKDIHYHNNHESWGKCVRLHKNANWYIPHKRGKSCANSRVDGYSIPDALKGIFKVRDMRLMTPSCMGKIGELKRVVVNKNY